MTLKLTVIILNYKKYEDLHRAISSVNNQIGLNNLEIKIHITDNASGDENTKKIQQCFPLNSYMYNKENLGFARAVNQAIKLNIGSDYFMLLNDDAEIAPDCLKNLLKNNQQDAIVGPAIFYKSKPDTIWQGGGYFNKYKLGIIIPEKNKRLLKENRENVDFLSGCVILIPKKLIEKIGYFDEKFFFYGEDLDFCIRAKKSGFKIIYERKAHAWHNIEDISKDRTSPFVLENLAIAYFLIIRKHFKIFRFYGIFLFVFLYTPFRFFQILKGGGNIQSIKYWILGGKIGWQKKI